MSKINTRAAAFAKFNEYLPLRAELGNTGFRKSVIHDLMEMFNCSLGSASTHYNNAFKMAKLKTPELVEGLGRAPEKNNGGRKPSVVVNVVEAGTGVLVASKISRNKAAELVALAAARNQPALEVVAVVAEAAEGAEAAEAAAGSDEAPEAEAEGDGTAAIDTSVFDNMPEQEEVQEPAQAADSEAALM